MKTQDLFLGFFIVGKPYTTTALNNQHLTMGNIYKREDMF